MAEKSGVDLVEEWQTGAFLIFGSTVLGFVLGGVGAVLGGQIGGVSGFIGGAILGFLLLSYILYGR
ncbi:hypothetical protein ACFQH2_00935 [Natronoarchaeum sp. GCM10025703]|uniref:hypothetical protein n=1 Tax=unclassified Natronoarchaeum TaxID=2620183 RepID=UPI00361776EC